MTKKGRTASELGIPQDSPMWSTAREMMPDLDGVDYLPEKCAACGRVYTTFACDHASGIAPDENTGATP